MVMEFSFKAQSRLYKK